MKTAVNLPAIGSWVAREALKGIVGNLAWVAVLAIFVVVFGSGALIVFFRTAAADFFQADVQVWHLVLVLAAVGFAAGAHRLWLWRRRGRERMQAVPPIRRRYISYKGADWDVNGRAPRCPKDHTHLGWASLGADDDHPLPFALRSRSGGWDALKDGDLNFTCLKCGAKYDLNGDGSMAYLQLVVGTLSEADA